MFSDSSCTKTGPQARISAIKRHIKPCIVVRQRPHEAEEMELNPAPQDLPTVPNRARFVFYGLLSMS
jgi:hypothetical protein